MRARELIRPPTLVPSGDPVVRCRTPAPTGPAPPTWLARFSHQVSSDAPGGASDFAVARTGGRLTLAGLGAQRPGTASRLEGARRESAADPKHEPKPGEKCGLARRVAPVRCLPGAPARSGLGDFHHPAPPPVAAHEDQICTRMLGLGSGFAASKSFIRSQLRRERWLLRFSHRCQTLSTPRRNCRKLRVFPLTPK